MQFSEILCALRKEHDMTQSELSDKSGVSCVTISFYETGRSNPVPQQLIAIADVLYVSLDTLVGRTTKQAFPQILADLRSERNLSRAKLAKMSGITELTLMNYEHGKRDPVPHQLIAIADVFCVTLDELVGHEVKQAPCTDASTLPPPEQLISKIMLLNSAQREEVEKYVDYVLSRG